MMLSGGYKTLFGFCAEAECCRDALIVPLEVHLSVEYEYESFFFLFGQKTPFSDNNVI